MRTKANSDIMDYWLGIRGGQAAPLRTALDPVALRRFLPSLFIAMAEPEGDIVFRLAGTRICEIFGREFRASAYADLWAGDETRRPLEIAANVIHYERPALLDVFALRGGSLTAYEMLLLPLRSPGATGSDRVLGTLIESSKPEWPSVVVADSLTLENWTFLDKSDVEPAREADEAPERKAASALWQFLPGLKRDSRRAS